MKEAAEYNPSQSVECLARATMFKGFFLFFSVTNANTEPNFIVPKAVLILSELSTIYSAVLLGF